MDTLCTDKSGGKKNFVSQCIEISNALRSAKNSFFNNIITGDVGSYILNNQKLKQNADY